MIFTFMMTDLITKAGFYHSLGMNLTCLKGNVNDPKSYKDPVDKDWELYFSKPQSIEYVLGQDWENASGIGLILGFNEYRAIDIDNIRSGLAQYFGSDLDYYYPLGDFIKDCLSILKLPPDYEWVVESGSGQGLHIIFKAKDIPGFECRSWAFGPSPYDDFHQDFECFELRWKDHLVLSPSKHTSGNRYSYVWTDFPSSIPKYVEIDDINNFINEFSLRAKKSSYTYGNKKTPGKYIYYKRGRDIGGSWGSFFCDVEDNYFWLKECHSSKALLQLGVCYMMGRGDAKTDFVKAAECYKKSNIPEAFYNLAYLMSVGAISTTKAEFDDILDKCKNLFGEDEKMQIKQQASLCLKIIHPISSTSTTNSTNHNTSNSKNNNILFFDTETTGLPADYNAPASNLANWPRLVQLSWIVAADTGKIIKKQNYIVRPNGFTIPVNASRLHGITTEKASKDGVYLQEIIDLFLRDLQDCNLIVGHNIEFDKKIVGAELLRLGLNNPLNIKKSYCTMEGSTNYCKIPGYNGRYKYPKLQELYRKLFGRNFDDAHNSAADTQATMECYFEMKKRGLL